MLDINLVWEVSPWKPLRETGHSPGQMSSSLVGNPVGFHGHGRKGAWGERGSGLLVTLDNCLLSGRDDSAGEIPCQQPDELSLTP